MKIAAIEAMWQTEPAPAPLHRLRHSRSCDACTRDDAIRVPWVLGLIATRSLITEVPGIIRARRRCAKRGSQAACSPIAALRDAAQGSRTTPRRATLSNAHVDDLGYALLLKRYTPTIAQRDDAARSTRRRGTPCPPCCRCSGVSASWWRSASSSSPCSPSRSVSASRRRLENNPAVLCGLALWSLPLALDRRGARLVRRRSRAPALDHRRRAADLPLRLEPAGGNVVTDASIGFVALLLACCAVVEVYLMVQVRSGSGPSRSAPPKPAPSSPLLPVAPNDRKDHRHARL